MNNTPTILVICERQEQFAAAASMLRDEGYCVRFENGLSESLSLTGPNHPLLIISELAAPNVDGLKLCRTVKNDLSGGTTPVLLVGDLSITSSIVEDGFRCGAANYLQRPIDPLRLADICRDILQPIKKRSSISTSIDPDSDTVSSFETILRNETLRTTLFHNSRAGLAIFSATGEMVESNAVLRSMLDYAEDEFNGMTLADFFFPYDLDSGKIALEELLTGNRTYFHSTNCYLTSVGERIWGSLTIIAITDADAGSRLMIGIFDDAEDKRYEQPTRSAILDLTKWKINEGLICDN